MPCGIRGPAHRRHDSTVAKRRRQVMFLSGILGLTWPVLAMAQDRAPGTAVTDRAALQSRLEALRSSAAANGAVRVIVSVAPIGRSAAGSTPEIEAAKRQITDRLRGPDAPVIDSIAGTPYVVMELTPRGVERLAADPAVQAVQEDRPERTQ
jgi:hypothetical protein